MASKGKGSRNGDYKPSSPVVNRSSGSEQKRFGAGRVPINDPKAMSSGRGEDNGALTHKELSHLVRFSMLRNSKKTSSTSSRGKSRPKEPSGLSPPGLSPPGLSPPFSPPDSPERRAFENDMVDFHEPAQNTSRMSHSATSSVASNHGPSSSAEMDQMLAPDSDDDGDDQATISIDGCSYMSQNSASPDFIMQRVEEEIENARKASQAAHDSVEYLATLDGASSVSHPNSVDFGNSLSDPNTVDSINSFSQRSIDPIDPIDSGDPIVLIDPVDSADPSTGIEATTLAVARHNNDVVATDDDMHNILDVFERESFETAVDENFEGAMGIIGQEFGPEIEGETIDIEVVLNAGETAAAKDNSTTHENPDKYKGAPSSQPSDDGSLPIDKYMVEDESLLGNESLSAAERRLISWDEGSLLNDTSMRSELMNDTSMRTYDASVGVDFKDGVCAVLSVIGENSRREEDKKKAIEEASRENILLPKLDDYQGDITSQKEKFVANRDIRKNNETPITKSSQLRLDTECATAEKTFNDSRTPRTSNRHHYDTAPGSDAATPTTATDETYRLQNSAEFSGANSTGGSSENNDKLKELLGRVQKLVGRVRAASDLEPQNQLLADDSERVPSGIFSVLEVDDDSFTLEVGSSDVEKQREQTGGVSPTASAVIETQESTQKSLGQDELSPTDTGNDENANKNERILSRTGETKDSVGFLVAATGQMNIESAHGVAREKQETSLQILEQVSLEGGVQRSSPAVEEAKKSSYLFLQGGKSQDDHISPSQSRTQGGDETQPHTAVSPEMKYQINNKPEPPQACATEKDSNSTAEVDIGEENSRQESFQGLQELPDGTKTIAVDTTEKSDPLADVTSKEYTESNAKQSGGNNKDGYYLARKASSESRHEFTPDQTRQKLEARSHEEVEDENENQQPRRIRLRDTYPTPKQSTQPRASKDIIRDHIHTSQDRKRNWIHPNEELKKLLRAATDPSLPRRSNACGALKVITQLKKNKLALVRTAGFLQALVYAATTEISSHDPEATLDTRARAVSSLFNVSDIKENRIIVFSQPGLPESLVQVIREDQGEARLHACGTLAQLAKNPVCRQEMVKVDNLITVLSDVLQGTIDPMIQFGEAIEEDDDQEEEKKMDDDSEVNSLQRASSSFTEATSVASSENSFEKSTISKRLLMSRTGTEGGYSIQSRNTRNPLLYQEHLRLSRMSSCAALLHLSRHCAVSDVLCAHMGLKECLVELSADLDDPMNTKCLEILFNLTRFPPNIFQLARFPGLVDALINAAQSSDSKTRVWALQSLQNISSDGSSKAILATSKLLKLLTGCVTSNNFEEQHAAMATLFNISTEPSAVVPITSTRNVVATLVHFAHTPEAPSVIRLMACNALATVGLWLQTVSGFGTVPKEVKDCTIPSHKTTGWELWD